MAQSGGNKKQGRSTAKCKRYTASHNLEKNKVKRVLKSSGHAAAEEYAAPRGMLAFLKALPAYKKPYTHSPLYVEKLKRKWEAEEKAALEVK